MWADEQTIVEIPSSGFCVNLILSPDHQWLAAEMADGDVWLCQPETQDCSRIFWNRRTIGLGTVSGTPVSFSTDSRLLAVLSEDEVQWVCLQSHLYGSMSTNNCPSFTCLGFIPETHCLLLISIDGFKWHLDIGNFETPVIFSKDVARSVTGVPLCLSPDARYLITTQSNDHSPALSSDLSLRSSSILNNFAEKIPLQAVGPFHLWNLATFTSTELMEAPSTARWFKFSPDSKFFSIQDRATEELRIYASASGRYLHCVEGPAGWVGDFACQTAFSSDNSVVAIGNSRMSKSTIYQYSLHSAKTERLCSFTEFQAETIGPIIFYKNSQIISISRNLVINWNSSSKLSTDGNSSETDIKVSSDNRYFLFYLLGKSKGRFQIRDVASSKLLHNFEVVYDKAFYAKYFPYDTEFSGDSLILYTRGVTSAAVYVDGYKWNFTDCPRICGEAGDNYSVQFFSISTGSPTATFTFGKEVVKSAISKDGNLLAVITGREKQSGFILHTTMQNQSKIQLEGFSSVLYYITLLMFSDDRTLLVCYATDTQMGSLFIWDTSSGHLLQSFETHNIVGVDMFISLPYKLAISPCNNIIALAGHPGYILKRIGAGFKPELLDFTLKNLRGFSKDSRYLLSDQGATDISVVSAAKDFQMTGTGMRGAVFNGKNCIIGEGVYLWLPANYRRMTIIDDTVVLKRPDGEGCVFVYLNLPKYEG